MSWNIKLKNIIDEMTERYKSFKNSKSRLILDLKDIFQYAANSVNSIEYNNNISGIKFGMDANRKELLLGIYNIRSDLNALEKTILNNDIRSRRSGMPDKKDILDNNKISDKHMPSDNSHKNSSDNTLNLLNNPSDNYHFSEIYTPERLSQIIEIKNKYFWKTSPQLQDIIQKEANVRVNDISSLLKDAMKLKVNDPKYSAIARINYDSNIASQEMKEYFIIAYTSREMTLKQISREFENKYGMHISVSTISRKSRNYLRSQGLDFKNRKEAKKYYKTVHASNDAESDNIERNNIERNKPEKR